MTDVLNRPMCDSDLAWVAVSPHAQGLRRLVADMRAAALPVMNGSFLYSNLREGDDQIFTCSPYRLWEYSSLFLLQDEARPWTRALDVGGAASPLPYLLAAGGIATRAIDLQPLLVAVCTHVATASDLPLEAAVEDVTSPNHRRPYDLITFISVLEHVPQELRASLLDGLYRRLEPGGLLYLTFDYGTYTEADRYKTGQEQAYVSASISDLPALCDTLERCGFEFVGNDPRELPADVLALKHAPAADEIARRFALTVGPIDAATPWRTIGGYLLRRLLRWTPRDGSRFHHHNYFRMFLRRPR